MKRSSVSLTFNIFLGLGLLMLVITAVICYNVKKFNAAAVKTSGTVVDLIAKGKRSYAPVVTYNDDAGVKHRFVSNVSSNPPGYEIGERIDIYYDPKNPDDAEIAGWREYFAAIIIGGLGLVFSLTGLGYYIVRKVSHSRREQLKQSGRLIQASFESVDINASVQVNRRHPFFIRCNWKDPLTGESHRFKSGFIWSDPTPLIDADKKIDVYMDRNNPRKYYVDVSSFERQ
jgi:flagellar biogenesis protein FliO